MATPNPLIRKTSHKIWLFNTLIVSFVLICFSVVVMGIYNATLFNSTDRQLFEQIIQLEKKPDFLNPKDIFEKMPPPVSRNMIMLVYLGDEVQYVNPNPFFDKEILPVLEYEDPISIQVFTFDGSHYRGIVVKDSQSGYTYKFISNVDNLIHSKGNLLEALLMSSILLIIFSSLIGYLMAKRTMRPIEKNFNEQVRFVQDASHEMRTPLAILQGKLELVSKSQTDAVETHLSSLSQMMTEIKNLEKLTNDLLQLSKLDLISAVNPTEAQVNDFLSDFSSYYDDLAEFQEKQFTVEKLPIDQRVNWDLPKVKRMVSILLENAFKYTSAHNQISLTAATKGRYVILTVTDNGIGISKEDQPFIFERFYRSPQVRAGDVDGSGIGLSLLKAISEQIGVTIELNSELGAGTSFTLSIPMQIKKSL